MLPGGELCLLICRFFNGKVYRGLGLLFGWGFRVGEWGRVVWRRGVFLVVFGWGIILGKDWSIFFLAFRTCFFWFLFIVVLYWLWPFVDHKLIFCIYWLRLYEIFIERIIYYLWGGNVWVGSFVRMIFFWWFIRFFRISSVFFMRSWECCIGRIDFFMIGFCFFWSIFYCDRCSMI